jgi:hypothetical protein
MSKSATVAERDDDPLGRIDGTTATIATGCHTSGAKVAHTEGDCARLVKSRTRTIDLAHQPGWYWRPCPECWPGETTDIHPEGWSE